MNGLLPDITKRKQYLEKGYCSAIHIPTGRWCVYQEDMVHDHLGLYVNPRTKRFSPGFAVVAEWEWRKF